MPFYISYINLLYPNIKIELFTSQSSNLIKLLNNGEVDFIIDEFACKDKFICVPIKSSYDSVLFVSKERYDDFKDIILDVDYLKSSNICLVSKNKPSLILKEKYNFNYDDVESTPILINKVIKNGCIRFSMKLLINNELNCGLIKTLNTNLELPISGAFIIYKEDLINNNVKKIIDVFKYNCLDDIK